MFTGHYSAAFIAAAHPKAPGLGALFVGAQLVDFAFFTFVPLGVEAMRITPGISVMNPMDLYHMPYTHSLLGSLVWAVGFATLLRLLIGNWTAGLIGGAVVLSHWVLDVLVHVPDMTIAGIPPRLGFGLWNYPAIEMPLELAILAGSILIFARAKPAALKSRALPTLIGLLMALQAFNWFAPPPVAVDIGMWGMGLAAFTIAALTASWVARTRVAR